MTCSANYSQAINPIWYAEGSWNLEAFVWVVL